MSAPFTELTCPFCGVDDFDDVGLKIHLTTPMHCDAFEALDIVERLRGPADSEVEVLIVSAPDRAQG